MTEETVAIGRRKTAVASVRLRKGKGAIKVNDREFKEYFPGELQRRRILVPFDVSGNAFDTYDMLIRVKGGGLEGQATAIRLGIARALDRENDSIHQELKSQGLLTRDSRKRERKKYGLAGARKRFQFSKR